MTIFLTTHYMDEAEICNKVAVMDHGKIIAFDEPHALKQRYTKDKVHIASSDERALESLLQHFEMSYEGKNGCFAEEFTRLSDLLDIVSEHRSAITDIEIKKGTLNDVFLEITGKDIRG
ncbi:DUF4162 domain-containing protein [Paenibacillus thiaminolyticus]|uniref:hypothetical protein n=1 Tax=Paenibacillus thiaminolyticus TaxID=49283 RepID=UPI0035A571F9